MKKGTKLIRLKKDYFPPLREDGRIDWQRTNKTWRKKFGRAYVRFHGIKTTKELATGPHSFYGLLNVLTRDKTVAYVFERKNRECIFATSYSGGAE